MAKTCFTAQQQEMVVAVLAGAPHCIGTVEQLRGEQTAARTGLGRQTYTGTRCWNPLTFRQVWPRLPADYLTLESLLPGPRDKKEARPSKKSQRRPYGCGAAFLGHSSWPPPHCYPGITGTSSCSTYLLRPNDACPQVLTTDQDLRNLCCGLTVMPL